MKHTDELIKKIRSLQPRKSAYNKGRSGGLVEQDSGRKLGRNNWNWLQQVYPEVPGQLTIREVTGLRRWLVDVAGDAQRAVDKARYLDLVELVKTVDMTTFEDKVRPWVAIGRFFNDCLMAETGLSRIEVQRRLTMIASLGLVLETDINYIEGRVRWVDCEQEPIPF